MLNSVGRAWCAASLLVACSAFADDILTERHGSGVNQLNQEAIVNASSNDVLPRLEALEGHPELYESKRNTKLTDEPISLISFEERFRKLLRDVSGSK